MGTSFVNNPEHEEGGQRKVVISDLTQEQLLSDILEQLKIMNLHLSSMTDEKITKGDIE